MNMTNAAHFEFEFAMRLIQSVPNRKMSKLVTCDARQYTESFRTVLVLDFTYVNTETILSVSKVEHRFKRHSTEKYKNPTKPNVGVESLCVHYQMPTIG